MLLNAYKDGSQPSGGLSDDAPGPSRTIIDWMLAPYDLVKGAIDRAGDVVESGYDAVKSGINVVADLPGKVLPDTSSTSWFGGLVGAVTGWFKALPLLAGGLIGAYAFVSATGAFGFYLLYRAGVLTAAGQGLTSLLSVVV